MTASKIVAAAASGAGGGAGLDVDEVFSTQVYETASSVAVNNGIDLSGEGGLVWIKTRDIGDNHFLNDTARGTGKALSSDLASAESTTAYKTVSSFNSNGYTAQGHGYASSRALVSWTFRKAPNFFDVVTYSGTSNSATDYQDISHNLGAIPGMVIVKRLNSSENWAVWHRSIDSSGDMLQLNIRDSKTGSGGRFSANNQSNMTATTFRVYGDNQTGANGGTYVAYLFAHNNSDGEFGPDSDQDIIKCGTYNGTNAAGNEINLGFEPQWLLIKATTKTDSWFMFDNMRGLAVGGTDNYLEANDSAAEAAYTGSGFFDLTATGFKSASGELNQSSQSYIYMAIRRGPLAVPEDATKVFAIDFDDGATAPAYVSGFVTDMGIQTNTAGYNKRISTRLTSGKYLETDNTGAEQASTSNYTWDFMNGWNNQSVGTTWFSWMWKRAPGYFDVVCYDGQNNYGQEPHNLAVPPEILICKGREETSYGWSVIHTFANSNNAGKLNSDVSFGSTYSAISNFTSTHFPRAVDWSGQKNIAYLFASAPGVSKCGTYTGTGDASAQTIDCGFSSGAKMVIIKCVSHNGQWYIFDVDRGITNTVNDGVLMLNNTTAQSPESSAFGASIDAIQPDNSGFKVQYSDLNTSGRTFLFYAVA